MISKNEIRKYFKRNGSISHKKELEEFLKDKPGRSLQEKAFLYINGIKEIPKCPVCGKELKFNKFSHPYNSTCSKSCAAKKRYKKFSNSEKAKLTMQKKYGVSHIMKLEKYKKIVIEKQKQTNLERYGVENQFQRNEVKEIIREKQNEIKEKIKQTNLEKYGVEYFLQTEYAKNINNELRLKKRIEKIRRYSIPLFDFDEYDKNNNLKWKCVNCGYEFYSKFNYWNIPLCPKCYPRKNTSFQEKEIKIELLNNYEVILNDRNIISPYEIDIYIPEKKLGIEFNGLYWHSENKFYHFNKFKLAKEKGIKLIQIFEDEWNFKKEIVKSILRFNLNKVENKIYARKCEIKEINSKLARNFFNENHLQGYITSKVKIGLFYDDKLIEAILFSKPRFNKNFEWEITRFANLNNYIIIGGFPKLLKYFENKYRPKSIISYADLRYFTGKIYLKNGFKFSHYSKPNYYYLKNHYKRFSRIQFQKHKLKNLLENYDENLSEWENMKLNGYDRIWDCGNAVYIKKAP